MNIKNVIGREVLDSRGNPTIEVEIHLDEKKSGDYIIIEARHNYRIEKFDTTLLCAKIGSIGEQQEMFA